MKTVAIASLKGGVGKTTVAANVGAALAQHAPGGVLLVDCDPRNQLGMHFGVECDAAGFAEASLRGASWARAIRNISETVACVPFGSLDPTELRDFDAMLAHRPERLHEGLNDRALQHFDVAVLDCAAWPSQLLDHVLPLADVVLFVLMTDPASFATLPLLQPLLGEYARPSTRILLNCVDGTRLATDVRAVVSGLPNIPLLPFAIHRDQAVPEALASQRPLLEASPSSQAAADFRMLAEWVVEAIHRFDGKEPTATGEITKPAASAAEAMAGGATS